MRIPFLVPAMISLLAGVWVGLYKLDWPLPLPRLDLAGEHGPLMMSGFLGTLIALERAVALGSRWGYLAPGLTGLGGLLILGGAPWQVPANLFFAGGIAYVVTTLAGLWRGRPLVVIGMAAGGIGWAAASLLWLGGRAGYEVAHGWIAFLVLTIAAERVELSRFAGSTGRSRALFVAAAVTVVAATFASFAWPEVGARLAGAGHLGLAFWLLRYDIARHSIRAPGLPRFTATCLLTGYGWLALAGGLLLAGGAVVPGPYYDAILHALFLGFGFSMIFGHAPIIFPAVTKLPVPYRPGFYVHVVVLHLTLVIRVAGDLILAPGWGEGDGSGPGATLRAAGALGNALAILLFIAATVRSVILARRGR